MYIKKLYLQDVFAIKSNVGKEIWFKIRELVMRKNVFFGRNLYLLLILYLFTYIK